MEQADLKEYIDNLAEEIQTNHPKRFFGGKKKFYDFVKAKLNRQNVMELNDFPTCWVKNISTKSNDYDVVLMAHYDTPPRIPRFSYLLRKCFGVNRSRMLMIWYGIICLIVACVLYFLIKEIMLIMPSIINVLLNLWVFLILLIAMPIIMISGYCIFSNPNNMNDNSSGVIAIMAIVRCIEEHDKNILKRLKIVLTDFEEYGRWGAMKFKKAHKLDERLIFNFDCVGLGKYSYLQPLDGNNKDRNMLKKTLGDKYCYIEEKILACSDYDIFKSHETSFGFTFLEKSDNNKGYYVPNMHTPKDTKIDPEQMADFCQKVANFIIDQVKHKYHF